MNDITHWKNENNMLVRTFVFDDFMHALQFVQGVGALAEQQQHHPDIHMHDYSRVTLSTCTHDQGNIVTDKDMQLVHSIDALYATALGDALE